MANLLVEIGNTALKAAWAEGNVLGKTFRYQGEKRLEYILSLMEKDKPEVLTLATARDVTGEEREILSRECGRLMVLDSTHKDFLTRYSLPEHLTYDRAASVVAAEYLFKGKSCMICDFGTTLTIDFVDGERNYKGGNISLGCRTRFKALNRYSRTLPLVNTPQSAVLKGMSSAESIESGVILGIVFEIEGYMASQPENVVIFTGGDAIYFAKRMKNSIFVVCNLVLMGLALITDDYVRENLQ